MRAEGQISSKNEASGTVPGCPSIPELKHTDFFGSWAIEWIVEGRVERPTAGERAELVLGQNPEWKESLAGEFILGNARTQVFGDVDEGEFSLEETLDGKNISAVWTGRVEPGSCGRAITGARRASAPAVSATPSTNEAPVERRFVMRRKGW
jgi:hypothetical protein